MVLLLLSHFSRVRLCATPQTAAHQAPPSLGFSRQEHWSGLPFPYTYINDFFTINYPSLQVGFFSIGSNGLFLKDRIIDRYSYNSLILIIIVIVGGIQQSPDSGLEYSYVCIFIYQIQWKQIPLNLVLGEQRQVVLTGHKIMQESWLIYFLSSALEL